MIALKSLAAILALGVISATAAPADNVVETKLVKARQNTVQVHVCEHIDWRGACRIFTSNAGACFNLPSEWNDRISSIQNLQSSNFHCVWWQHGGCTGEQYDNQEDADLADGNGAWNDRISSWRCS
ncbi:hypothetical protein MMYC01_201587 [Madurella mycetomatis]|uniref:Uncharacterized protein n=1 Tax=Madurella mycetomatis TaxID=100816 RepID=A0A175WC24_9PEZI|nr:hypothetical protein MMYC01_201587 [Madurella mycetomatis]